MFTVLTSNIHSTTSSGSENSHNKTLLILTQISKFAIVLAAAIGLFNLNLWAGVAFVSAIFVMLLKDGIAFLFHILQSDFDLTKDIFRDLEPF